MASFNFEVTHRVLWSQVLGNVPGKIGRRNLLRECSKVLKPGGILSLSVHDFKRTLPLISTDMIISDHQDLETFQGEPQRGRSEAGCFHQRAPQLPGREGTEPRRRRGRRIG